MWVAARPFAAASHRGGTLTVVSDYLPARDPVQAYDPFGVPALATVYDGLVALRRSGGAAGLTLVPDLARTLPRPAGGGTTYTFTLRRGIRYSNGTLVRASDFRRGIQRQLSFGFYPPYYEGILGGQTCHQHPRRCDLSAGIITDDAAGTVTFHLGHADPEFLYKLALLLAVPAPPGAPDHAIYRAPFLPGTGPYKLSQYRPHASVTLVRNPYFRQWSYAAQPAGYPNVIRFDRVAGPARQESAVIAGRADLMTATYSSNGQSLATRYPARVHTSLKLATEFLFLNTRQPPFTSLKARQAVSYAIDRGRILQLSHLAPGQAAVTCQILPADFPGHQGYCPYTTGTKDGIWHSPDMAKARRLAKDSHTTNVPVTVWILKDFASRALGSYLVRVLKDLGYRAHQRTVPDWPVLPRGQQRPQQDSGRAQRMGRRLPHRIGILPARPELPLVLPGLQTKAEFCDPHADQLASQAQAAQLTDPATARRLWAQVDRIVTDQAPWVPILSFGDTTFVSARTGNYQESPISGPLYDQMWVR